MPKARQKPRVKTLDSFYEDEDFPIPSVSFSPAPMSPAPTQIADAVPQPTTAPGPFAPPQGLPAAVPMGLLLLLLMALLRRCWTWQRRTRLQAKLVQLGAAVPALPCSHYWLVWPCPRARLKPPSPPAGHLAGGYVTAWAAEVSCATWPAPEPVLLEEAQAALSCLPPILSRMEQWVESSRAPAGTAPAEEQYAGFLDALGACCAPGGSASLPCFRPLAEQARGVRDKALAHVAACASNDSKLPPKEHLVQLQASVQLLQRLGLGAEEVAVAQGALAAHGAWRAASEALRAEFLHAKQLKEAYDAQDRVLWGESVAMAAGSPLLCLTAQQQPLLLPPPPPSESEGSLAAPEEVQANSALPLQPPPPSLATLSHCLADWEQRRLPRALERELAAFQAYPALDSSRAVLRESAEQLAAALERVLLDAVLPATGRPPCSREELCQWVALSPRAQALAMSSSSSSSGAGAGAGPGGLAIAAFGAAVSLPVVAQLVENRAAAEQRHRESERAQEQRHHSTLATLHTTGSATVAAVQELAAQAQAKEALGLLAELRQALRQHLKAVLLGAACAAGATAVGLRWGALQAGWQLLLPQPQCWPSGDWLSWLHGVLGGGAGEAPRGWWGYLGSWSPAVPDWSGLGTAVTRLTCAWPWAWRLGLVWLLGPLLSALNQLLLPLALGLLGLVLLQYKWRGAGAVACAVAPSAGVYAVLQHWVFRREVGTWRAQEGGGRGQLLVVWAWYALGLAGGCAAGAVAVGAGPQEVLASLWAALSYLQQ